MHPALGLLLVVLFWGGNFSVSKLALAEIPPLPFTAIRFAAGSALLWLVVRGREGRATPPPGTLGPLLGLGVLGNTVYQLCFIQGLARTTATNSALILASMPTVVTVGGGLLGLERTTARERWALALATVGVVAVVLARGGGMAGGDLVGDLLMLGAVLCWAGYTLGLRRLGTGLSPLALTTWTMVLGTPGLVLAGLPGLVRLDWGTVSPTAWAALAYATLLSLVAAYLLWSHGVQRLGAGRAALLTLLTPLVATVTAMLLLHERPGPVHLAGGACILGGVLLGRRRVPAATSRNEG